MSKIVEYVGFFHALKDRIKESWTEYWQSSEGIGNSNAIVDNSETNFRIQVKEKLERLKHQTVRRIDRSSSLDQDFSHLTRPKTRKELLKISAAVMGIEFAYAAETAFVSPLLLNIGLRHRHMTLMWCLSPLVGFFVTPILGSLSDGCRSQLGRRRPFILLLSIGIILGLILVPNGKLIGRAFGDTYIDDPPNNSNQYPNTPPIIHLTVLDHGPNPSPILLQLSSSSFPPASENYSEKVENMSDQNISSRTLIPNEKEIPIKNGSGIRETENPQERMPVYKKAYFSKYTPRMEDHGFRMRNNLYTDDGGLEFLKSLGIRHENRKLKLSHDFNKITENVFEESGAEDEDADEESSTRKNFNFGISQDYLDHNQNLSLESLHNKLSLSTVDIQSSKGVKFNEESNSKSVPEKKAISDEDAAETEKSRNEDESSVKNHPWGLVFTVLGTVLLDFDADACQSPSRAYMLDVTMPDDHARGLSTFTVMAGLGGSLGYLLGALNWENTFVGNFFGGQVRAVFTLVLFIFIGCVITTIRSFREIPIDRLWTQSGSKKAHPSDQNTLAAGSSYARFEEDEEKGVGNKPGRSYGSTVCETSFTGVGNGEGITKSHGVVHPTSDESVELPTFKEYMKTVIELPKSLQWLCITNYFCWLSLVCYSLYFTDFVGEAVFNGNPTAPLGSALRTKYDDGVRFGCWGMSLYSLSCSIYSLCIESLVSRFGAKRVYISGQLVYSVGMVLMAITRDQFGVILLSWTAGIMYATLFTMPYLLVARYHAAETFDLDIDDLVVRPMQMRGLGTDVAIVSSMVFLAQMTQALTLGSIVAAVGSTTAIVCAAAVFAACGACAATKVLYLDL